MSLQNIFLWASQNVFGIAAICFGGATLIVILYTYMYDYAIVDKSR